MYMHLVLINPMVESTRPVRSTKSEPRDLEVPQERILDWNLLQARCVELQDQLHEAHYQIGSLELELDASLQRAAFFENKLAELAGNLSSFQGRVAKELMGFLVSASIAQEGPLARG